MEENRYEALKLKNQLCFPTYACAREFIKSYKPYLDKLDLTYTQYIALLILWEKGCQTVKELGTALYLDSGTLTPMLKKMESKGLIERRRSQKDERNLVISLTEKGMGLREEALIIPQELTKQIPLSAEEVVQLYHLLYKLLNGISEQNI